MLSQLCGLYQSYKNPTSVHCCVHNVELLCSQCCRVVTMYYCVFNVAECVQCIVLFPILQSLHSVLLCSKSCKVCSVLSCSQCKQCKSRRSCLEKFALGKSRGKSDFPEGRSPEGKSDYLRDLPWANFQNIPKAFPLLVRLQASKNKENVSCRSFLNIILVSKFQT